MDEWWLCLTSRTSISTPTSALLHETVFDELVADLDAPVRPNPLRKLM